MTSAYSIQYTLLATDYSGTPRTVAKEALEATGLTTNADVDTKRVSVFASGTWGVDVPADRAEEYARELWKDKRTNRVDINGVYFPKPTEKTVEDVEKEFEAYKKKVYDVALRTKKQERWCNDGFGAAMKELGIEVPTAKVRVVLELDFNDYDLDVNVNDLAAVASVLKWDISRSDIADAVKSVEPIKD